MFSLSCHPQRPLFNARLIGSFVIVCFFLISGCLSADAQTVLGNAAHELTTKLHQDPDVSKINGERLVIAQFDNITGSGDAAPKLLQSMLTTEFIDAKRFKVVERDQLKKALDELNFGMSDLVDADKARKVGKLVGATYILLGDMGQVDNDSTYISARLVFIESGESVAAKSVTVKIGDTPPASDPVALSGNASTSPSISPDASPSTSPTTSDPASPQKIDLASKATTDIAGTWEGGKPNLGLLGGTDFKIAWREKIGPVGAVSFACGDLLGNGTRRIALRRMKDNKPELAVLKWTANTFEEIWHSEDISTTPFPGNWINDSVVAIPVSKGPATIITSSDGSNGGGFEQSWTWDSSTFAKTIIQPYFGRSSTVGAIYARVTGIFPYDNKAVWVTENTVGYISFNPVDGSLQDQYSTGFCTNFDQLPESAIAADFDGDSRMELAVTAHNRNDLTKNYPIYIYDMSGTQKAETSQAYGPVISSWRPPHIKTPFIVAQSNTFDSNLSSICAYLYFIRWSGENYAEFWKSNRIEGEIDDMRVCDPKYEGQDGLVVLSDDGKNCYLTKIVLAQ